MPKNNNKIKQISSQQTQQTKKEISQKSLYQQLKQMRAAIVDKSITTFSKFFNKLNETPAVYVLPLQNRKISEKSQSKLSGIAVVHSKNSQGQDKKRSNSTLNVRDEDRLKQLLTKRSELMNRLKAIDKSLQIRNTIPITVQVNESRDSNQNVNTSRFRQIQSRINIQNSQTYNLAQHERNVEMLSRLTNQRMRRQQKLVMDMRRKQESEMRKLEEIQRNKSQMQLSRQLRPLTLQKLKSNNLDKLQSIQSIQHPPITTNRPFQNDQNQFDQQQQVLEMQEEPGQESLDKLKQ